MLGILTNPLTAKIKLAIYGALFIAVVGGLTYTHYKSYQAGKDSVKVEVLKNRISKLEELIDKQRVFLKEYREQKQIDDEIIADLEAQADVLVDETENGDDIVFDGADAQRLRELFNSNR